MPRTVPVSSTQAPGNLITSALWNAGPAATNTFLTTVPLLIATQSSLQNIPDSTLTAITYDATTLDTDGGHSNVTNNSRYTAQVAGWYLMIGTVMWAPNGTGNRLTQLYKNGVQFNPGQQMPAAGSTNNATVQASALVFLAVGDYIQTFGYQTSGSTLGTGLVGVGSSMQVIWLHA